MNPNPVFKVTPLFDTEYLTNGYRYGHSYYRRCIRYRTKAFEWHQFQVTILFNVDAKMAHKIELYLQWPGLSNGAIFNDLE